MNFKNFLAKFGVVLFLVLFVASGFSFAQRLTGKIMGVVSDEEGTPLPGVTVELSSPNMLGGVNTQVTNDRGVYRFINLTPGRYKLIFKLPGFQTAENTNIDVSIEGTVTQNVSLKPATLSEEVTVTAATPTVDVTKSSVTTSYDKDQLEKLPFTRNTYFDMVNQTPGFNTAHGEAGSRFTAYGSNSEENGMYMDGVDLSNPEIGTAWSWPTADVFEEVQISGIGNAAEYGNFSGAVVNIVTKSGGNKFSGSVTYYGQFKQLTGDNNPEPYNPDTGEGYYSFERVKWYDYGFTLGGPVIKDRIWFFAAYNNTLNRGTYFLEDPSYPSDGTHNEQLVKLSAQISRAHKLVLVYNRQKDYGSGSPNPFNTPETILGETDFVNVWSAMWTWLISNNSYFEIKYSGYYSPNDYLPAFPGGDIHNPYHYDGATGVNFNGPAWPWFYWVTRNQVNATYSHFAEGFLGGDHEFKVGVQFNRGTSDTYGGYGGGKFYYDYAGEPYYLYEWDTNRYGGTVVNIGAFFDDSWKIGERLTINLGLRYDHHNAFIPSFPIMSNFEETGQMGKSVDNLITWNSFSPRIGIAYQLTSDQKTLFKASYGRYYVYPYIANWEYPGVNAPPKSTYLWNGTGWDLINVLPTEAGFTMDPGIKDPYYDQFSVGIERELLANFSMGATFIYKSGKDNFGYIDKGAVFEQVQRTSQDNGQTYTAWNWVGGEFDYWLTNPEGWGQTYKGLILQFNKRYSNRWLLNASVTWSRAEGLNLSTRSNGSYGMSQSLVWYTGQVGADPNDLINAKGVLNLDKTWMLKVSAGYNLPLDFFVSFNYAYTTGRPTLKFVRIPDLNQPYVVKIQAEEKGEVRFEAEHLLNFRIEKAFTLYKSVRLRAMVDVFNLLNDATITRWQSNDVWRDTYQVPNWIPDPRRAQVGIKLEF